MMYAKTIRELCNALSMSDSQVCDYKSRTGFPPKGKQGWLVEDVTKFILEQKATARDRLGGPDQDKKREKLTLECEILRVKLDELLGNTRTVQQYNEALLKHARIVKPPLERFPRDLMAEVKDPAAIRLAEKVVEKVLGQISDELAAEGL